MDSMTMNFEFLAKETLELSKYLSENAFSDGEHSVHNFNPIDHLVSSESENVRVVPESSGIIFRVDKGPFTFCLRGCVTDNIANSFKQLDDSNEELISKLRVEHDDLESVRYFETESIYQAEIIIAQLFNRRFPIHEESVCNISDPGFSWWMKRDESSFQLFYNSYSVDRATELIKLGPIGDHKFAQKIFLQLESAFNEYFEVNKYESKERSFLFEIKETNHNFDLLMDLFAKGEDIFKHEFFSDLKGVPTFYYYLLELSALRKFWLLVEEEIDNRDGILLS